MEFVRGLLWLLLHDKPVDHIHQRVKGEEGDEGKDEGGGASCA